MPPLLPRELNRLQDTLITLDRIQVTVKLESIAGKGSYSVVYKGSSTSNTSTHVAVKCIAKKTLSESQLLRQHQEALLIRELIDAKHEKLLGHRKGRTRIIQLLETKETDDMIYLVLQFCDLNLFTHITAQKVLPSQVAEQFVIEILEGASFMHRVGVYHRDLKPENILLCRNEIEEEFHLKIADFGLATRQRNSSEFGCGSQRYYSPECLNDFNQYTSYDTSKNDVWSIAIIMINMVSGKGRIFH
jgi:serine/threonine protein kinase